MAARCASRFCGEDLNVARFFTPYVDGLYRQGASSIFVSRGIGTIVLPMRVGSAPEVALLRLVPAYVEGAKATEVPASRLG